MKGIFLFVGIAVFGAVLTTVIDNLFGVEFKSDVSQVGKIIHNTTHMFLGAAYWAILIKNR